MQLTQETSPGEVTARLSAEAADQSLRASAVHTFRVHLHRGHLCLDGRRRRTLMRYVFSPPSSLAPTPLPLGPAATAVRRAPVAPPCPPHALPTADGCALPRAVPLAPVTAPADSNQLSATPAPEHPMAVLESRPPPPRAGQAAGLAAILRAVSPTTSARLGKPGASTQRLTRASAFAARRTRAL